MNQLARPLNLAENSFLANDREIAFKDSFVHAYDKLNLRIALNFNITNVLCSRF